MSGYIDVGGIQASIDLDTGKLDEKLAKAEKALGAVGSQIQQVQQVMGKAGGYSKELEDKLDQLIDTKQRLVARSSELAAALRAEGDAARSSAESMRHTGRIMMQLGYMADDIQFGFKSIVNNIQPLADSVVRALNVPHAELWSGAIGIASVATYQLYTHWDQLMELMGQEVVKTEAEEMAELAKQTQRTADEAERLARFRSLGSKTEDMRGAKTEGEKKSEDTATKAITEAGVRDVAGGIKRTAPELLDATGRVPEVLRKIKEAEEEIDAIQSGHKFAGSFRARAVHLARAENQLRAAKLELPAARDEAAESIRSASTLTQFFPKGPGQLAALVRKNPDAFGPHNDSLLDGLTVAQQEADQSPEARQRDKAGKAIGQAWDKVAGGFWAKVDKQVTKDEREAERGRKKDERDEKREKREEQDRERDWRRDNLEVAHMVMPGIDKQAEDAVLRGKLAGMPMDQVGKSIALALRDAGMGDDDAKVAAKDVLADVTGKVEEKVAGRSLRELEAPSRSEIYDAAGLTAKIQGGIGDDDRKRQISLQEKMLDRLAELVKASGNNTIRLRVD